MTKEQIIKKHLEVSLAGSVVETFFAYKAAMESYAQQQAIEFAKWMIKNMASGVGEDLWVVFKGVRTSEQLYQEFQQSKLQQ